MWIPCEYLWDLGKWIPRAPTGTSHLTAGRYPNPKPGEKWGDELSVAAGGFPGLLMNTSGGWGQELSLVPLVQGWRMNPWPEMTAQVTLSSF